MLIRLLKRVVHFEPYCQSSDISWYTMCRNVESVKFRRRPGTLRRIVKTAILTRSGKLYAVLTSLINEWYTLLKKMKQINKP